MKRALVACLLLLACCGGDDEASPAEQACLDTADAFGDLCVRCGVDSYDNCHRAIEDAVEGDCSNTVSIKDKDELYGQCIPFFENVSCSEVTSSSFMLDPSCVGQLQHR